MPPPPEHVPGLLEDLFAFCRRGLAAGSRSGGDRPRAVRDDPPVRGRQRPGRTRAHPHGPAPPRSGDPRSRASLTGPRDMGTGLRRWADRLPATAAPQPPGRHTKGSTCGSPASPRPALARSPTLRPSEARIALSRRAGASGWGRSARAPRTGPADARPSGAPLFTVSGAATLIDRSFTSPPTRRSHGCATPVGSARRTWGVAIARSSTRDRCRLHRSRAPAGEPRRGHQHRLTRATDSRPSRPGADNARCGEAAGVSRIE